ncbi:MAG: exodeoxyribonuclease VII large subunit [Desulfamplus sp.]|nr:exodeoxyribonuclease VII large subunit [Desulfamplus sp.]
MVDDKLTFSSGNIYTVSLLTKELKNLLEETYPFIWITGEISNYSLPSSGHAYFSLKDKDALINCVMFRNQKSRLGFNLENGIKIIGIARLSLYEPRGTYQLIFEHIESSGVGSLQIRFEQLKRELELEGIFDQSRKKELPFIPSKLFIITSPTGSVIRDIIHVSQRRFEGIPISIVPVKVQGEGAEAEIKDAIELVNNLVNTTSYNIKNIDDKICIGSNINKLNKNILDDPVIIIARGGGSLEDLSAFNSETVARAVFESEIPIISAVGHETDFTICDFAADVRAATPSAAAEIAVPEKRAVQQALYLLQKSLSDSIIHQINILKKRINDLQSRLKNPIARVYDIRLKLDDIEQRLNNRITRIIEHNKEKLDWITHALYALSPIEVLNRGYSITRLYEEGSQNNINVNAQFGSGKILMHSADAAKGDSVMVILSKGKILCQVNESVKD